MKKDNMPYSSFPRLIISIIAAVLLISVLAIYFIRLFGVIYISSGSSMQSTISNGDVLLINNMTYRFKAPERFDLILIEKDNYDGVKRIAGLPGESVEIKNGKLYIDGELLNQDYWEDINCLGEDTLKVLLGENEYFVLGDNLPCSEDSRSTTLGAITINDIVGKPWFCCYPFNDFGLID